LKENTGMEPFPKDEQGNRLYSDIHYVETYKVQYDYLFFDKKNEFELTLVNYLGYGRISKRRKDKIDWNQQF
jgi:hypothetical protein